MISDSDLEELMHHTSHAVAAILLATRGMCNCYEQQSIVAHRFLPYVRGEESAFRCHCDECLHAVSGRLVELTDQHARTLLRGCHGPLQHRIEAARMEYFHDN